MYCASKFTCCVHVWTFFFSFFYYTTRVRRWVVKAWTLPCFGFPPAGKGIFLSPWSVPISEVRSSLGHSIYDPIESTVTDKRFLPPPPCPGRDSVRATDSDHPAIWPGRDAVLSSERLLAVGAKGIWDDQTRKEEAPSAIDRSACDRKKKGDRGN